MSLPSILNGSSLKEAYAYELIKSNKKIQERGLALSPLKIQKILESRSNVLQNYGRIELDIKVTKIIVEEISSSVYINSDNFVDNIIDIQDIFYYIKNETEDKIGDQKLLDIIKKYFENECAGSIDLLRSKIESFAEGFRRKIAMEENLEGNEYD